ncbi:MAG: hypothetical protein GTO62_08140 [Planctomycetales bacterium]|nr:hypothetical protein [Planctomycetales bacterium]
MAEHVAAGDRVGGCVQGCGDVKPAGNGEVDDRLAAEVRPVPRSTPMTLSTRGLMGRVSAPREELRFPPMGARTAAS